jgi:uncharacterized protein (DUF2336 family)
MQPDIIEPSFCGLDDQVFMDVIATGDIAQRINLALQLAAFLAREDTPQKEREQVVPAVLKLTADPEPEVREALAAGLAGVSALNADVLFAIVADDDEIALPFLAGTPALSPWHMLAVLRVGDDARRATVALRPDVSAEAVDYVIESLPLAVNALMLENEQLVLTPDQYRALYARFGEEREILDFLLASPGLPLDIRVAHARLAASRMQDHIIERGWIPANDATEIVAEAEENAILGILTGATAEQRAEVVSFLVENDLLTPSIIVRAACTGAMEVVAEIMANLAGLPLKRAEHAMFVKSAGSFRSLHAKAGLPQSCYWTLQAACDVAREERQDGIRLTPEDYGRRLIEVLMTRYEALPMAERPKQLDVVGRFASDRARLIARRLKADLLRAA